MVVVVVDVVVFGVVVFVFSVVVAVVVVVLVLDDVRENIEIYGCSHLLGEFSKP